MTELIHLDMSTHERRQLALAKQIDELEQEAIGPKDWTLLGEASSRARPENSLLEEDLDFEQVGKVVPVVTEDTVKTLEEMIKTRIRDVSDSRQIELMGRTTSTRRSGYERTSQRLSSHHDTSNYKTSSLKSPSPKSTKRSIRTQLLEGEHEIHGTRS